MNFLRSVSTYSNTRYNRWFSNTTSDSLEGQYTACERCNPCHAHNTATHPTMFGWLSSFSSEISRMAVLGTPSSSTSNRIFLRAMIRRDRMSRALYTTPYVPSPTFSSFSYLHRGPKTRVSHLHHQHATQQPRTEIERPCRTAGRLLRVLWARRLPGPPQPPPQQHQQHQRQQSGALQLQEPPQQHRNRHRHQQRQRQQSGALQLRGPRLQQHPQRRRLQRSLPSRGRPEHVLQLRRSERRALVAYPTPGAAPVPPWWLRGRAQPRLRSAHPCPSQQLPPGRHWRPASAPSRRMRHCPQTCAPPQPTAGWSDAWWLWMPLLTPLPLRRATCCGCVLLARSAPAPLHAGCPPGVCACACALTRALSLWCSFRLRWSLRKWGLRVPEGLHGVWAQQWRSLRDPGRRWHYAAQ